MTPDGEISRSAGRKPWLADRVEGRAAGKVVHHTRLHGVHHLAKTMSVRNCPRS
ncbi:hypothetical protein [Hymenobacter arizonensis]|uniref:hypothetical protein n=1 Tax=Hymenobacter arizonensis TaxID=1227077 RepID=UPI0015A5398F|nr:hypothetical protein [Hymenobacter arizonensis]